MELELDQEGSVDDVYTDEGEWLEAQIRSVVWPDGKGGRPAVKFTFIRLYGSD